MDMSLNQAVSLAIRTERTIADLTVKELVAKSGIPESTLMRILQNQRDIKVDQLDALADAFGIKPSFIVARAEDILAGREELTVTDAVVLEGSPQPQRQPRPRSARSARRATPF